MASPQRKSCLPIVERGCCCDLKTCCKWQGWLCVIGSVLSFASSVNSLIQVAAKCDELYQKKGESCSDEKYAWAVNLNTGVQVASMVFQATTLITAALFLHGISQNNPRKLLPFIYFSMVQTGLGILLVAFLSFVNPVALIGLLFFALPIYCVICANSLHIQMTEGPPQQQYNFVHPNANFVHPKAMA